MAHLGNRTLFVPGALPGERVRAEVSEVGKVLRAQVKEILSPSPGRRAPACPLAERCGGCDWLHAEEGVQREAKQEIVVSALEHLGGISRSEFEVRPFLPSPQSLRYRRRLVLHFASGRLGLFGKASHQRVPIDACPAAVDPLSAKLPALSAMLAPFAKDADQVVLLAEGDQVAISIQLRGRIKDRHAEIAERTLQQKLVAGAVLIPKEGSARSFGKPTLQSFSPLHPEIPHYLRPDAFAQANAEANWALVASAMRELGPRAGDRVLELYCGNGNFSFAAAALAREVVGIESSGVSLELARRSAREGGVANVRWVQGDVLQVCKGLVEEGERFDLLLADPPRSGAPGLAGLAGALGVRRVVYVACDPGALARDAGALRKVGFRPRALQVVDLFPQTRHVEAVLALDLAEAQD